MPMYALFAHDGEHTFQENFEVAEGDDPRAAGARHVAAAWGVDLGQYAAIDAYIDELDEFDVAPASADQSVLDLLDSVRAFLDSPGDAGLLAALRGAYSAAAGHRDRYEPANTAVTVVPVPTYMPLHEAKAIIERHCGTEAYAPQSHGELWCVANLPSSPQADASSYVDVGIERIDCPKDFGMSGPGFDDDAKAVDHVRAQAAAGSRLHAEALAIDHAADSVRFHLWGPEWVDSRIGPSAIAA